MTFLETFQLQIFANNAVHRRVITTSFSGNLACWSMHLWHVFLTQNQIINILERLMLPQINTFDSISDKYQFGFKSGHSTSQCAGAVKEVFLKYYVNKNSHVCACFIDLTKAFDRVNY